MENEELFKATQEAIAGYKDFIEHLKKENEELKSRKNANCDELEEKYEKVKKELEETNKNYEAFRLDTTDKFESVYNVVMEVYSSAEAIVGNPKVYYTCKGHENIATVLNLLSNDLTQEEERMAGEGEEK